MFPVEGVKYLSLCDCRTQDSALTSFRKLRNVFKIRSCAGPGVLHGVDRLSFRAVPALPHPPASPASNAKDLREEGAPWLNQSQKDLPGEGFLRGMNLG